ncbi:hypothetical protein RSSM_02007 [Rhodopirellula sallentina SM41]|uniref:Uncharacterized protein n=1 Tax=Rhodopirellula sallentina SM41 TaxID=1263870 RepID=M5U5H6_9BACT|nr:hypothetical protein RSSM_02007 [Rhodopirellula sallentina SM41]
MPGKRRFDSRRVHFRGISHAAKRSRCRVVYPFMSQAHSLTQHFALYR